MNEVNTNYCMGEDYHLKYPCHEKPLKLKTGKTVNFSPVISINGISQVI